MSETRSDRAKRLHGEYRGKIQTAAKVPIGPGDLGIWYTPGVAEPCRAIFAEPDLVFEYTNRANTVAIVTDGSRILGLGNIGPEAGLPVMEGKALLFKYLGGVDAVPICLGSQDETDIVRTVAFLSPTFGGINLEDISQPKCFRVLDEARRLASVPVWHDDQQGTATVALAALINALRLVGKDLSTVSIALIGIGAANVATYRLLRAAGVHRRQIVACDSRGILHADRSDLSVRREEYPDKWRICTNTNPEHRTGGIAEALRGADVCISFSQSGPDVIRTEWVETMAENAIIFACANPVPEIWPEDAKAAGAEVIATGSSDLPNQVNNSLAFPGVFRGVLDVRAVSITDEMAIAAARGLAAYGRELGVVSDQLLPPMDDVEAAVRVAVATASAARSLGLARVEVSDDELADSARDRIADARKAIDER